MKNKKNKLPYLTALLKTLAPKIGAKVIIEPEWGIVSQIIYKNGVVRSVRMYSLDLNTIASADIAKDKGYAKFFMKKKGYPVSEGTTIFEKKWAKTVQSNRTIGYGIKYAEKLGFPVITKPNSKSQGFGVSLAHNEKELASSLKEIFKHDKIALIEKYLPGKDYRVVVLDGEIISAYERTALFVLGDGTSSILKLIKEKQKLFSKQDRDTNIDLSDPRIKAKLRIQGLSLDKIPKQGVQVFLLDNANLSTGGEATDVTEKIHQGFAKIAARLTREMGLRMAGVDIMVIKGDITQNPKKCSYYIIEINAAPGLDHYITTGAAQKKKIEAMYLKILKALGKKD